MTTIAVCGLGHLGTVTAACLAEGGVHHVLGVEWSEMWTGSGDDSLFRERGVAEALELALHNRRLVLSGDMATISRADVLWVTYDTPVDLDNHGHPEEIERQLARLRPFVADNTLVILSSQVPVGFTRRIETAWRRTQPSLRFAHIPENLRRGRALADFRSPGRVVVGLGNGTVCAPLIELLAPFVCSRHIEWMTLESAEFVKHALNTLLSLQITYANELARIGKPLGVDPSAVARALRTDPRIGATAYLQAGSPVGSSSLWREVHVLTKLAADQGLNVPVIAAIADSDRVYAAAAR